jgi:hypothetical protein
MNNPKVIFKFKKEEDLWNHWHQSEEGNTFNKNSQNNPKIKKICEGKKFEECKDKLAEHLKQWHNSIFISLHLEAVEKAWRTVEEEFFKRMDKLMKNKFEGEINAYLTTSGTCPYDPDEPSFMFSLFYSIPNVAKTCGHEIMHLYFHKFYWNKIESEIGREKTADLKEALTVLLNLEFKDLWLVEDNGYEAHKELRNFIKEEWKKDKDFEKLLERCVNYLNSKNL